MGVLVADEDPRVRRSVVEFLRDQGLDVVGEAADSPQAVELCNRLDAGVVIVDLCMWLVRGSRAPLSSPGARVVALGTCSATCPG